MLPCWQQLRIGESTGKDIKEVFGREFALGQFDFLKDTPDRPGQMDVPGVYGKTYYWDFNQDLSDSFDIVVWTDKGTTILESMQFRWHFASRDELNVQMSPQRIIKELGAPSRILMSLWDTENAEIEVLKLLLIYDQGMVFRSNTWVPVVRNAGKNLAQICWGSIHWSYKNQAGGTREADIMPALTNGVDNLSPLQNRLIGIDIHDEGFQPIENVVGVTPDDIAGLLSKQQDPCIDVSLSP